MFSKPLREMTLAEVYAECNADPGEPLATPPGRDHRRPTATRTRRRPRRPARQDRPGRAPRQRTTRTPLHPIEEAGRLRALPRPDMSLPALQRARLSLRRRPHDRPPARAHQRIEPQVLCRFHHLFKTSGRATRLARQAAPRRRCHLDLAIRTELHHAAWQPPALPQPVPAHRTHRRHRCSHRHTAGLTMPRRKTTRAQDRQYRIDDERRRNEAENEAAASTRNHRSEPARWSRWGRRHVRAPSTTTAVPPYERQCGSMERVVVTLSLGGGQW